MKMHGFLPRILLCLLAGALLLLVGLTGARPVVDAAAPVVLPALATDDPNPPAETGLSVPDDSVLLPSQPRSEVWAGDPNNPNYDGRINATMADRYAVYCKDGEFQVWDGIENKKLAGIPLEQVTAMKPASNLRLDNGIALGRSNDVLTVVGPGDFVKDGISFTECTGEIDGR